MDWTKQGANFRQILSSTQRRTNGQTDHIKHEMPESLSESLNVTFEDVFKRSSHPRKDRVWPRPIDLFSIFFILFVITIRFIIIDNQNTQEVRFFGIRCL